MLNKSNTKIKGKDGEDRAAAFYEAAGFRIVGRNFRVRRGEIDIIAEKCMDTERPLLVFAEVKLLSGGDADTLSAELGKIKQRKIIETAKYFLKNHRQYSNSIIRFDAVVVDFPGKSPVYLIENAFSEN